ncbi:hypothetical protein MISHU_70 [Escherichia phage vB_EcoD_Mishu]|uniref:Uncharacterized protein n=1 Tax=Escherichia phage vB_EcoD_Mishu TaxID=2894792 RepID=A0AAE8YTX2_9CAUD|nr:hypothetical protein MISHU_70 [Escherichia phage vB_EcoD_Mishu]
MLIPFCDPLVVWYGLTIPQAQNSVLAIRAVFDFYVSAALNVDFSAVIIAALVTSRITGKQANNIVVYFNAARFKFQLVPFATFTLNT